MNNLVDILCLGPMLDQHGIVHKDVNFEVLYSALVASGKYKEVVDGIESAVVSYFLELRLPDHPTIYDYLVLSLRPKDFIATFNWDPFLEQAIRRNYVDRRISPPRFAVLHGCVSLGYCDLHNPLTFGRAGMNCQRCGNLVKPMRLLYPVTQKNYNADPHTLAAWHDTQLVLKHAYLFTIFGYGAPSTDVEAVQLLKAAWGNVKKRNLEQTEVIDIRSAQELVALWEPFIHTHHYSLCDSFSQSWIARHPRRSCEALFNATMMCMPDDERPIPSDVTLRELWNWFDPLMKQESDYEHRKNSEP